MTTEEKDKVYIAIGKNVAKARKKKGLTQMEMAVALGMKSISIIASGEIYSHKKHFNIIHLMSIAKLLEIDVCELLQEG